MTTTLPEKADYVIAGGGTAGLVVAARLSENPEVTVLVLESGPDGTNDPRVKDLKNWPATLGSELDWKYQSVEQTGLNNRKQDHPAGRILGGSSAINGGIYLAPSPAGIDAWASLGNPNWDWKSLRPYLEKSLVATPESDDYAPGSIKISYPELAKTDKDPLVQAWVNTFKAQGYRHNTDILAEESAIGIRDYAAAIDPVSGLRSSADREYGAVAATRSNVTIVPNASVRKILFHSVPQQVTATGVEVVYNNECRIVNATKEVILAAGAFHTPNLLELSGIGSQERLHQLGIPTVVDQPGVGENLQNHLMSVLPVPIKSTPESAKITAGAKAMAFTRLDPEEQSQFLAAYPASGNTSDQAIRSLIQSPKEASALLILVVRPGNLALLIAIPSFPFSRGSIHISSTDPDVQPTFDLGSLSNELDMEILAHHTRDLYDLISSDTLRPFLQSIPALESLDEIKNHLRASAATAHHICGTAAMRPREDGGVVDQDLRVYGTTNLRVVDASIFPLIPHGNPMSTVYAVAERAADIIRSA
ncbi:glucose-methanol-choline (gmc) oxidoreductase [Penicillium capsulatum]|uniref:glucose oxidase n=1 Tax=Penicillium capsulatum TaxID=69766 RepID=A0A9W9IE86_9EURO|nr:glucose-methanol-choline (gmc) oxidoreductase [Penicillium capsulatum]KAJ6134988.1 glucose-methanol-choline (gmc) oxidoreductase [Penicillium capsulatum]